MPATHPVRTSLVAAALLAGLAWFACGPEGVLLRPGTRDALARLDSTRVADSVARAALRDSLAAALSAVDTARVHGARRAALAARTRRTALPVPDTTASLIVRLEASQAQIALLRAENDSLWSVVAAQDAAFGQMQEAARLAIEGRDLAEARLTETEAALARLRWDVAHQPKRFRLWGLEVGPGVVVGTDGRVRLAVGVFRPL